MKCLTKFYLIRIKGRLKNEYNKIIIKHNETRMAKVENIDFLRIAG